MSTTRSAPQREIAGMGVQVEDHPPSLQGALDAWQAPTDGLALG